MPVREGASLSQLSSCRRGSSLTPLATFLAGTESETKAFMAVCIETAKRYNLDDYRTPVFIFERLCSIIYPVSSVLAPHNPRVSASVTCPQGG